MPSSVYFNDFLYPSVKYSSFDIVVVALMWNAIVIINFFDISDDILYIISQFSIDEESIQWSHGLRLQRSCNKCHSAVQSRTFLESFVKFYNISDLSVSRRCPWCWTACWTGWRITPTAWRAWWRRWRRIILTRKRKLRTFSTNCFQSKTIIKFPLFLL